MTAIFGAPFGSIVADTATLALLARKAPLAPEHRCRTDAAQVLCVKGADVRRQSRVILSVVRSNPVQS